MPRKSAYGAIICGQNTKPLARAYPLCYRNAQFASRKAGFPPGRHAGVAELADAQDLGSCGATRGGSSPPARTRFRGAILGNGGTGLLAGQI